MEQITLSYKINLCGLLMKCLMENMAFVEIGKMTTTQKPIMTVAEQMR